MREVFFFETHTENEAGRLVLDMFFKKTTLFKVKISAQHPNLNIFW